MLQLYRMTIKIQKQHGQITKIPHLEQLPITGLLRKRQRLFVIFGSAGSGKSTSLKRLAYLMVTRGLKFRAGEKPTIPFLLRAPDILDSPGTSLVELCDGVSRRLTGLSKAVFSTSDLADGRLFILIDALDELPEDSDRISVLSLVHQFHSNYPDCTVVVTSRDNNSVKSLAALKEFETYTLSPIDFKQAHQIIKTLQKGKNLPVEKSTEIVRRLEEVHGMELNPLLVTVFAATSEYSRQDIPANITELFKKFTEMMLGRWDATKGFRDQFHAPLKDFILTRVAFEMHKERLTRIDIERFHEIITMELANRGYVADTVQLSDEILNRSGLFIIVDGSIEFRHLMMQEFFAGRGISSTDYLHSVIADPWWRRAVVFYFGEHPDNVAALQSAVSALGGQSIEQNYNGALTLGLALQACYLVEVKNKSEIYRWVVDGLANAKDEFLRASGSPNQLPITRFLHYYLYGRDSVALSVLASRVQDILDKWEGTALSQDDRDIRTFWVIVGLIESNSFGDVERILKNFKPSDLRLLLGIHLGCYLTQEVRVSTKQQREIAKSVCDCLIGRIGHLRSKVIEEMKTDLLEVRKGVIQQIDVPSPRAVEQGDGQGDS